MKSLILAVIAAATLTFAVPTQSEARPWGYYYGRPAYRAAYRPYAYGPRAYYGPRPYYRAYRPYVGPNVVVGPGVYVGW